MRYVRINPTDKEIHIFWWHHRKCTIYVTFFSATTLIAFWQFKLLNAEFELLKTCQVHKYSSFDDVVKSTHYMWRLHFRWMTAEFLLVTITPVIGWAWSCYVTTVPRALTSIWDLPLTSAKKIILLTTCRYTTNVAQVGYKSSIQVSDHVYKGW